MWSLIIVLILGTFLLLSGWSSSAQKSQVRREMHEKGTDLPHSPPEVFKKFRTEVYERNFLFGEPKFLDVPVKYQRYHSESPYATEYLKFYNNKTSTADPRFWYKQYEYRYALQHCLIAQKEYDAGYCPLYRSKNYHKDRFNCWDYLEENFDWYMKECEEDEERWSKL